MNLDIHTLELVLCLNFILQIVVHYYQHSMNRAMPGIGWWLLGSISMAGGIIVMILWDYTPRARHSILAADTLIVAGQIFLYVGVARFIGKGVSKAKAIGALAVFIALFFYLTYINDKPSLRVIIITAMLAAISIMTAYRLFIDENRHITLSATAFLAYGCFLTLRAALTAFPLAAGDSFDRMLFQEAAFLVLIFMSTLWTFGFILMVNQRLNVEIIEEKENLELIFKTSPDAVFVARVDDGVIVRINEGFTDLTGYAPEETLGKSILDLTIWPRQSDRSNYVEDLRRDGEIKNIEITFCKKSGRLATTILSAKVFTVQSVPYVLSMTRDITDRKLAEVALRELEEKHRNMISNIPGISYRCSSDKNWTMHFMSDEVERLLGYPASDFIDSAVRSFSSVIVDDDRDLVIRTVREGISVGETYGIEYRLRAKNGDIVWVKERGRGVFDQEGTLLWIDGGIMDITERKLVEQALQASEEKLTAIFNTANIGISITDTAGTYVMFNDWWSGKLDYDNEEIQFLTNIDITHPDDKERSRISFNKIVSGEIDKYRLEKRFVRKDGSFFWADASVSAIKDKGGNVANVVAMVTDITERKNAERQVQELILELEREKNGALERAMTDGLTGLANRRFFDDTLRTEFLRLKRSGGILSLIMVDIDHFKKFNDSYGHVAGDECLKKVASALQRTMGRAPDIVARYGGEEFAVILPDTESHGAALLAERIRKSVENLAIPYLASGTAGYVTISLGFVTVPAAMITTQEQVVALADSALYAAKDNGRNRVEMTLFPAEFRGDSSR